MKSYNIRNVHAEMIAHYTKVGNHALVFMLNEIQEDIQALDADIVSMKVTDYHIEQYACIHSIIHLRDGGSYVTSWVTNGAGTKITQCWHHIQGQLHTYNISAPIFKFLCALSEYIDVVPFPAPFGVIEDLLDALEGSNFYDALIDIDENNLLYHVQLHNSKLNRVVPIFHTDKNMMELDFKYDGVMWSITLEYSESIDRFIIKSVYHKEDQYPIEIDDSLAFLIEAYAYLFSRPTL